MDVDTVTLEIGLLREALGTDITLEGLLARVGPAMVEGVRFHTGCIAAHLAHVLTRPRALLQHPDHVVHLLLRDLREQEPTGWSGFPHIHSHFSLLNHPPCSLPNGTRMHTALRAATQHVMQN